METVEEEKIGVQQATTAEKMPASILSYGYAKEHSVLITDIRPDHVQVIYQDKTDLQAIIELNRYFSPTLLQLEEVNATTFNNLLTRIYEKKAFQVAEDIGEDLNLQQLVTSLPKASDLLESENDAPVIRLINALLRDAIEQKASDIHFETFENTLDVRLRIDGMLHNVLEVPETLAPLIISRIKVMANLDISEKRLPQDGRITVKIAGRSVDIRVSTMPVTHGERVVLRLLDTRSVQLNLSQLGMSEPLLELIHTMIAKPHGIILVTGPTGSGKTTTLYAMLTELNIPGRNIMTVEDPVEYELLGIAQTQVNPKIKMTFARSLRAILRQDPDIVMVGEIRDAETAKIAIQASLTGHLVLSTLHTNTAIGAITRLRDMGVQSFLLSSSLSGLIAQRLVRLLCDHCKVGHPAQAKDFVTFNIPPDPNLILYSPHGCEKCKDSGYLHRTGIYEVIEIDNVLRTMIHENESEQKLEEYAHSLFPSIWQDGIQLVLSGETSIEEIIRVTFE